MPENDFESRPRLDEDFSAVIRTAQQMAGLVEGVTGTKVAA